MATNLDITMVANNKADKAYKTTMSHLMQKMYKNENIANNKYVASIFVVYSYNIHVIRDPKKMQVLL